MASPVVDEGRYEGYEPYPYFNGVSVIKLWRLPEIDWAIPGFVLSFAVWTIYCHIITVSYGSFDDLMQWLPLEVLVILAVLAIWFWHGHVGPIRSGDDSTCSCGSTTSAKLPMGG